MVPLNKQVIVPRLNNKMTIYYRLISKTDKVKHMPVYNRYILSYKWTEKLDTHCIYTVSKYITVQYHKMTIYNDRWKKFSKNNNSLTESNLFDYQCWITDNNIQHRLIFDQNVHDILYHNICVNVLHQYP